jgi:phosphoglycolate phosphatase-like HAD superfamily hydrolase
MIGDRASDIEAAHAAGIPSAYLADGTNKDLESILRTAYQLLCSPE